MTTMSPHHHRPSTLITPLACEDLLAAGTIFPRDELARRILSFFWHDCCRPASLSRAPAPVIEFASMPAEPAGPPVRIRAWWLLEDGIVPEIAGPYSHHLWPYSDSAGPSQLWPRYEFQIVAAPIAIEMGLHRKRLGTQGHCIGLAVEADGRLRVLGSETLGNP